jgi:hypothetical protein
VSAEDQIFAAVVVVATAWASALDIRASERWPSVAGLYIGLLAGLLVLGDR